MLKILQKNYKRYVLEAAGLGIFMASACGFSVLLESPESPVNQLISNNFHRLILMGIAMGGTALGIFYSPIGKFSGAHINPAVTLSYWRLGKIHSTDAFFYIFSQYLGGTLVVYLMAFFIGNPLTAPPINYAITIPANGEVKNAFVVEFLIAFVMMTVVLWTSRSAFFSKFTRIFAGCLVCINVVVAAPISGFGMNPARTFASALPAQNFTDYWLYFFVPIASMLLAAEMYRFFHSTEFLPSGLHPDCQHEVLKN